MGSSGNTLNLQLVSDVRIVLETNSEKSSGIYTVISPLNLSVLNIQVVPNFLLLGIMLK